MALQSYSTVAANNNLALTGLDVAEGCAPSSVNDSMRQLMADVKTRFDADYATTATAAGTTTLTSASVSIQVFTGATTQTLVLPVATTLTTGRSWLVVNSSTGAVTINSSGSNLVHTLQAGGKVVVMCILASGTDAASWLVLTAAKTDAAQTFTGVQSMTSPSITTSVVTPSTTVAVFNDTATTVNAFGAASVALNIGHASAAAAFPGGISIPTGKSVTGAGTATVTGFATVSATTLTGTLSTAAQPNVTSLGTLTSLTSSGNITSTSETGTQLTLGGVVASGVGAGIVLRTGSAKTAWNISAQSLIDNTFSISPSTAIGGATFTTPVFSIDGSGNGSVYGNWTVGNAGTGALTAGAISTTDVLAGVEISEPAAPSANGYKIFAIDSGGGKTILKVRFASGASQTIATEP